MNKKNDSERERSVTSYIAIILLSIIFYENIYITYIAIIVTYFKINNADFELMFAAEKNVYVYF